VPVPDFLPESPIPALLPSSMERYRDQKTRIVISSEQVANAQFVNERTFLPEGGLWRVMHNTNWFGAFAVAILYAPPSLGIAATRVSVWEGLS
jgi:hypothetical protein